MSNKDLNSSIEGREMTWQDKALKVFLLFGIIYVFLVSLELMGASFKMFEIGRAHV